MGWVGCYDLIVYCDHSGCGETGHSANAETSVEARNQLRVAGWWFSQVYGAVRGIKVGLGVTYCPKHKPLKCTCKCEIHIPECERQAP